MSKQRSLWTWLSGVSTVITWSQVGWMLLPVGMGVAMASWAIGQIGTPFGLTLGAAVFVLALIVVREAQRFLANTRIRKASVLAEIRKGVVDRMNQRLIDSDDILRWCAEHQAWYENAYARVENEVSPLDAERIFIIGDASQLPPEVGLTPDHAAKMRWLRCYSNRLGEAIEKYRD